MSDTNGMTAEEAYQEAKKSGWSQELEDIVVNSKDSFWAYWFALRIKGANIPKLEQIVIDSGNPKLAYSFAFIEGANIPKLEQIVIDSGDPGLAYSFAQNIPGANISDLVDFVLINEPWRIKELFKLSPSLRRKYELGEIRHQIRKMLA